MENTKNVHHLTYKNGITKEEIIAYTKAVLLPTILLLGCFFVILKFGNFGKLLLAPLISAMWVSGLLAGIILPSHRQDSLKQTITTIGIYIVSMFCLRMIIGLLSGVSATMLVATFNQAIPETSGNATLGYIQTLLYMGAVMTPLGFIGMQFQKIYKLKRNANKKLFFDRARDIRDTNGKFQ